MLRSKMGTSILLSVGSWHMSTRGRDSILQYSLLMHTGEAAGMVLHSCNGSDVRPPTCAAHWG